MFEEGQFPAFEERQFLVFEERQFLLFEQQNFERLKNCEDGSDFDDFLTKSIAVNRTKFRKNFRAVLVVVVVVAVVAVVVVVVVEG